MLNVGVPEFPQDAIAGQDRDPELEPEEGIETGEQADLTDDSDPYEERIAASKQAENEASDAPNFAELAEELKQRSDAEAAQNAAREPEQATASEAAPLPLVEQPPPPANEQQEAAEAQSSNPSTPEPVTPEQSESFGDLLSEFERTHRPTSEEGNRQVGATVVSLTADSVFLDIGFKTEGVLPLAAFATAPNAPGKELPKPGDKLFVTIKTRNEEGYYELSLLKLAQPKDWSSLEAAFAEKATVVGTVTGAIKGGLSVDVGVRAFMPASRSGARDARDLEKLVGQEIRCRIIKLDVADEDVVVDRRLILEEEERSAKERRYSEVAEGETINGTVRSLTTYGAFVDIGGVDALLHISDMAWSRVADPADLLSVGQQIDVKVLKIEPDKRRISVGLKQLQPHPWDAVPATYAVGQRVTGVVTRLTDFGAFVELAPGIEGLVHISEMSWAKKVRKPSDMVKPGDTVEVVILSVNQAERRVSLGLKQALGDPWVAAADKLFVGAVVEGPVVSFTKFGAFVQVAEGIEGMVHISEIVADKRINHPQDELHLGQIVKAQVLEVDREKRQLKLSIKQLIPSSLDEYLAEHKVGDVVSGRVIEASPDRLMVELGEGIRVACKPPAAAAPSPHPAVAPQAMAAKTAEPLAATDLSALSSMLKAKWKSGPTVEPPPNRKSDAAHTGEAKPQVRSGEVRSFRITAIDPAAKEVRIELA